MTFKIGVCQINLDADFKTTWANIKQSYPFKEPYTNKIYAISTQYNWGGGYQKYNQIEVKGFEKINSIVLTFYDDIEQAKLYAIIANLESGHMFTLYNVQDTDKIKTLDKFPDERKIIMEALEN